VSKDGSHVQCTLAPESMTHLWRLDLLWCMRWCAIVMHLLHAGASGAKRIIRVLRHSMRWLDGSGMSHKRRMPRRGVLDSSLDSSYESLMLRRVSIVL